MTFLRESLNQVTESHSGYQLANSDADSDTEDFLQNASRKEILRYRIKLALVFLSAFFYSFSPFTIGLRTFLLGKNVLHLDLSTFERVVTIMCMTFTSMVGLGRLFTLSEGDISTHYDYESSCWLGRIIWCLGRLEYSFMVPVLFRHVPLLLIEFNRSMFPETAFDRFSIAWSMIQFLMTFPQLLVQTIEYLAEYNDYDPSWSLPWEKNFLRTALVILLQTFAGVFWFFILSVLLLGCQNPTPALQVINMCAVVSVSIYFAGVLALVAMQTRPYDSNDRLSRV